MDGHDRKELVNGPAVRQRLEQREVAEVAIHEHRVQIDDDVLVLVAVLHHDLADGVDGRVVHLLGHCASAQREHAAGEQLLRALLVERDIVEHLADLAARRTGYGHRLVVLGHLVQQGVIVFGERRHGDLDHRLHVDHLQQQQGVVRRERAARLADDVRHGQLQFTTRLGQRVHDVVGVLLQ